MRDSRAIHREVVLRMHQGSPQQVASALRCYKTDVELGLGVGIVASIAYDEDRDQPLVAVDVRHLIASNMTQRAIRRGAYLRDFAYPFIETFASPLTRSVVEKTLTRGPDRHKEI